MSIENVYQSKKALITLIGNILRKQLFFTVSPKTPRCLQSYLTYGAWGSLIGMPENPVLDRAFVPVFPCALRTTASRHALTILVFAPMCHNRYT